MPSWWMPLSCAKAFRPTIALLYCTGKEVTADTSFEARVSMVDVDAGRVGQRVARACLIAITTSSSAALPARSPMPLMVHSTCRAPPSTPGQRVGDREAEVVVAMDREDRLVGVRHALAHVRGTWPRYSSGSRIADRVGQVDRGGAGPDRGLDAAAEVVDRRARRVHGRPFDVVDEAARLGHGRGR